MSIEKNVREILVSIPNGVELVAAAKTRTAEEISEAVIAGIRIIGENYVQEAERVHAQITLPVKWHFIGSLQKNKVKKAVSVFDLIETVDSYELAQEINRRCSDIGKRMEIFIEINSASEKQKTGVSPEEAEKIIGRIAGLSNLKIKGLMTMGPFSEDPEESRPYFKITKQVFENIRAKGMDNVEMRHLSMGMTASYKVAIEEGATMVRIGTGIFGERKYKD